MSALLSIAILAYASSEAGRPASDRVPLGVVRVARERVHAIDASGTVPRHGRPLVSGDLIFSGMVIETGRAGWAEVHLLGIGRVRVSASTRVTFERSGTAASLRLAEGRAWIQRASSIRLRGDEAHVRETAALEVELPNVVVAIGERSSVIVEHTRTAGVFVAVRHGDARIASPRGEWEPVPIGRNEVATLVPDRDSVRPVARVGGTGIAELTVMEAQSGLGDLIGVRAFLLERIAGSSLRALHRRGLSEIVRGSAEVSGADSGPAGGAIEAGLRPSPFFEDEVPPKGPNVRVEVTFGDE